MKALSIFLLSITILISCNNKEKDQGTTSSDLQQVEMTIEGMTCNGCEQTIEANVMKLDGIKSIKADHETGKASLEYDAANADMAEIKKVIAEKGYNVTAVAKKENISKE
ncbi:Copper-ion-binding protein [Salinivirga cyanobacteriivorans]|uniref:Copper-ion-binding protein n=1 Tax=Salinivirga cyanobacteriivorans TaxID=1307839 RepID=A0A0S2I403_9BACT|nr:cation transporter [Salinivirga cyanobacteriivorans]ALO17177.1 Copper-ion-binding protein [Salinivirga cyanobacteriivorans]